MYLGSTPITTAKHSARAWLLSQVDRLMVYAWIQKYVSTQLIYGLPCVWGGMHVKATLWTFLDELEAARRAQAEYSTPIAGVTRSHDNGHSLIQHCLHTSNDLAAWDVPV